MIIEQDQLDGWRAFQERVRMACLNAREDVAHGHTDRAKAALIQTAEEAAHVGTMMERSGAQRPPSLDPPNEVPLTLLDTPANRRLLRVLQEARTAALDVDDERGIGRHADGPVSGMVDSLLAEVEAEVLGPAGRLRE